MSQREERDHGRSQRGRSSAMCLVPPGKARNRVSTDGNQEQPKTADTVLVRTVDSIDLSETIKTLLRLSQEQGNLTYDDINNVLPETISADAMDELYTRLRALDIAIVDAAEVEKPKPEEVEDEPDNRESLDDPVRMYMKQMGKVPLLTREQEVEVCKRIEEAEMELKRLVYSLGFTAKEHSAIAEKLLADPPKERFDHIVLDKKVN